MMDDIERGHAELRRMLDAVYERLTSAGPITPPLLPDTIEVGRRVADINSYMVADLILSLVDFKIVRVDNDRLIIDLNMAEDLLAQALKYVATRRRT